MLDVVLSFSLILCLRACIVVERHHCNVHVRESFQEVSSHSVLASCGADVCEAMCVCVCTVCGDETDCLVSFLIYGCLDLRDVV
jgi:hypothetical protein